MLFLKERRARATLIHLDYTVGQISKEPYISLAQRDKERYREV